METLLTEMRILATRIAGWRSILLHLALLFAFGIWIPKLKGIDFLDSQVLGAYACLGLIFAGPATAQAFEQDSVVNFGQAKARIFAGVFYGEAVAAALVGLGVATVNLTNRGGFVPQPDWITIGRCALAGLTASGLLAAMAALLAVRFSKNMAMIALRICFFGLLVLYYFRGQRLADASITVAVGCLVIAGLFVELLRRSYR